MLLISSSSFCICIHAHKYRRTGFDNDCVLGQSGQIVILTIIVDPVYHIIKYAQGHFVKLLIASSRKTRNSQLLESRNQNPTHGILHWYIHMGE